VGVPLYRVRIDRQGAVRFTLDLHELEGAPSLDLEVSTWVAGAYAFLRYGRDLFDLRAVGASGEELVVERQGLSGFQVRSPAGAPIEGVFLSGTVQARDAAWGELAGVLRDDGGILLPTAFPVLRGYQGPVDVLVEAGEGRQVLVAGVSQGSPAEARALRFETFDAWLDTPLVIGSPTVLVREVRGCRFEHVFCQKSIGFETEVEGFVDELVRIAESCHDLFGAFPFERYTWVISFDPRDHWGLEHKHGTMIAIGEDALIDEEQRFAAHRVAAHELFHAWNVWRLRPSGFLGASRTEGGFTDALWLCEGVTRYYEFLLLVRAGLMDPARVVENVVAFAKHHIARPAYAHTTLVDSSLATFLNHTRWAGAWNATLDYYDGGMLVAFELDALLRTRHATSLDEVFVAFYRAFEEKPGFDTAAFERFVNERAPGAGEWLARKVRQAGTLDVAGALQSLGLEVERKPRARVGVVFEKGSLALGQVLEGGAAYEAGLAPGDEIVSIDGYRATPKAFGWAVQRAQMLRVVIKRGHRFRDLELRSRYVDEVTGVRVGPSFGAAGRSLFGEKSAAWVEGQRLPLTHYDNFHGTEPIH
jgi:predicted metalloprotease with PDZ domain